MLTENDIKHASLAFLKKYYSNRPRIGQTNYQLDNLTSNGYAADGFISFQTSIDHRFEATFEATSADKSYEVFYTLRKRQLRWDSMVSGMLLGTLAFVYLLHGEHFIVEAANLWLAVAAVMSFILWVGIVYWSAMRYARAYRQIYALEQFKKYDADEQWVAVDERIFEAVSKADETKKSSYLREIKRQCQHGGFGLLFIGGNASVRPVITPSRATMGRRRKRVDFIGNRPNSTNANLGMDWENEKRFRYDFTLQLIAIIASAILLGYVFWQESQKTVVDIKNNQYRNHLRKKKNQLRDEDNYYIIDESGPIAFVPSDSVEEYNIAEVRSYDFVDNVWYDKNMQDSLFNILHPEWAELPPLPVDSIDTSLPKVDDGPHPSQTPPSYSPSRSTGRRSAPICKAYANWRGKRYILKDGVYRNRTTAEFRISQINKASALGGILRGGCFQGNYPYYIVYVDKVYSRFDEAKRQLPVFDELLKYRGYSSGDLELLEIKTVGSSQ